MWTTVVTIVIFNEENRSEKDSFLNKLKKIVQFTTREKRRQRNIVGYNHFYSLSQLGLKDYK